MDEETLRKTAYRIWEEQGRPHGQDFEHWFQAQAELDAFDSDGLPGSIASSVAPPAPQKNPETRLRQRRKSLAPKRLRRRNDPVAHDRAANG